MASVENVRLSITPLPNNRATVKVDYEVQGTDLDVAAQRAYVEICELVGRDTPVPSEAIDQVLHELHRGLVLFSHSGSENRARTAILPLSTLDEDLGPIRADEICARVRFVRVPLTNAYSNQVRIGPSVGSPGQDG